jgi:hypothetical protein
MDRSILINENCKIVVNIYIDDRNVQHLSIRKFVKLATSGSWTPTKSGITIPKSQAHDLLENIVTAAKEVLN